MTQEMAARCWLCGTVHECATAVTDVGTRREPKPDDGAVTLCIQCGTWCIFDSSVADRLRPPTDAEQKEIDQLRMARDLRRSWEDGVRGLKQ